jgi:hypothetical protein
MNFDLPDLQLNQIILLIGLVVGIGVFLTFTGQGPDAFSVSSTGQEKIQLNTLFSVTSCTMTGYTDCIQDTFTDGDTSTTAKLGYDSYNSPMETESLDYNCEGDKAILAYDSGYSISEMVDNYDDMTFNVGSEVSTSGSIPFTEIENGYTLICAVAESSGGDNAAGFIWIEDSSIDVQEEQEEEPAAPTEASITAFSDSASTDSFIEFDASDSTGEGDLTYNWYIEGSGENIGSGETTAFSPDTPGTYTVVVEVTSETGERDSASTTVEFFEPVTASATVSDTSVVVGDTVTFDAAGSTGENLGFEWYFEASPGDTVSTSENFQYTFTEEGSRTMVVEVSGASGSSDTASVTVDVSSQETTDNGDDGTGDDDVGFFQEIIDWLANLF